MAIHEAIFIGIVGITLLGAFMAVWLKNVFYNALSLGLCFFGVAGLFIYLNAEFLAVMEVVIYIGAITIAIIFAIMLSRPMSQKHVKRQPKKVARALFVSVLVFLALAKVVTTAKWPVQSIEGDYSIRAIGKSLLTTYALPFEAVSLVLLVAIIGALVISNDKEAAK